MMREVGRDALHHHQAIEAGQAWLVCEEHRRHSTEADSLENMVGACMSRGLRVRHARRMAASDHAAPAFRVLLPSRRGKISAR